ncbi:hypothetical protein KC353_g3 [Hortaea werneckii]|nr:hypothetical protein KC353_g3 [Hortaea werneckii]
MSESFAMILVLDFCQCGSLRAPLLATIELSAIPLRLSSRSEVGFLFEGLRLLSNLFRMDLRTSCHEQDTMANNTASGS